jgi:hypothetical protein
MSRTSKTPSPTWRTQAQGSRPGTPQWARAAIRTPDSCGKTSAATAHETNLGAADPVGSHQFRLARSQHPSATCKPSIARAPRAPDAPVEPHQEARPRLMASMVDLVCSRVRDPNAPEAGLAPRREGLLLPCVCGCEARSTCAARAGPTSNYGITSVGRDVRGAGPCGAICRVEKAPRKHGTPTTIGKVRGILCAACNQLLGCAADNATPHVSHRLPAHQQGLRNLG